MYSILLFVKMFVIFTNPLLIIYTPLEIPAAPLLGFHFKRNKPMKHRQESQDPFEVPVPPYGEPPHSHENGGLFGHEEFRPPHPAHNGSMHGDPAHGDPMHEPHGHGRRRRRPRRRRSRTAFIFARLLEITAVVVSFLAGSRIARFLTAKVSMDVLVEVTDRFGPRAGHSLSTLMAAIVAEPRLIAVILIGVFVICHFVAWIVRRLME